MSKFGLINAEYRPTDWFFGGFSPLHDRKTWQIDGNWERYLPVVEYQNKHGFDRMACVSYSLLNCLEIQYARQTGKEINWSDRALAKMSGTQKWGNRLDTVFDTARHKGLVSESLWPDTDGGWDEYYKTMPSTIFSAGEAFLSEFSLYREWVTPYRLDLIREALKEAPLQVTVKYASGNRLLNPAGAPNHAVCLYNISDGYEIFDHYTQTRKKYSLDYQFGNVLKPLLIKKTLTIMNINNNALVFKTQGAGYNFGIMIDGKLLIGETADVLGLWIMRNDNDKQLLSGNKVSVTLEDWNKLIHYDLKGNKI